MMRPGHLLKVVILAVWALMATSITLAASNNTLKDIKFSSLPNDRVRIRLIFDKALDEDPKHFFTKAPAQLILDFIHAENGIKDSQIQQDVHKGVIDQFLAAQVGDRLRLVFKLSAVIGFTQSRKGNEYTIDLAGRVQPQESTIKMVKPSISGIKLKKYSLQDILFRGGNRNLGRLVVKVADSGVKVDVEKRGQFLNLKFIHASAPQRLLRRFDVKDFSSPTQSVDLYKRDGNILLRMTQKGLYKYFAYQIDKEFVVEVEPVEQNNEKLKIKDKVYTGKRISLNFQNIEVRKVLQLLADFTNSNMVISDSVKGDITLRLNDVPWDQALDIIMKERDLDIRKYGAIMRIAPAEEIATQEAKELQAQNALKNLSPLISELIQINYAKASEIATLLVSNNVTLLSPRGKVSVDARTNTLWVRDVAPQLLEVKSLIAKLDRPVKQVAIEARVISVQKDNETAVGARLGLTRPQANAIPAAGGVPYTAANAVTRSLLGGLTTTSRYNVDLPGSNTLGGSSMGTIGIALAKLGRGFLLDLELSALEAENIIEVVSTPRLITSDQQKSYIEAGKQIPYLQASSSGATTVAFKEAVLKLEVTPQITPDGRVLMQLMVKKDTKGETILSNGAPAINTKRINTRILVNNGETIVLGGIYEKTKTDSLKRIPFFGKLPLIGPLFRNNSDKSEIAELIIFVTPKIIQQNTMNG